MNTKLVAVQFQTSKQMIDIFERMNITDFTISDEDDTMAEVMVTDVQFDELNRMDEVVYTSEL